jgi:TPR repeat protein
MHRAKSPEWVSFQLLLATAVLPLVSFGGVPPTSVGATKIQSQHEESEKNYRLGVQFAAAQDFSAATGFYRKAAEAGYAPAEYQLGCAYEAGLGIERDLKQAAAWYRKAADQGNPEAQNDLGAMYAKGQGVPRNDRQAVRWYRLAAAQKNPEATSNLGMMYLKGRGVKHDLTRAFELFRRAAEQGFAAAQNNLALMYANGQGVTRDFVSAWAWLDLAAEKLSASSGLQDQIVKEMTADDIVRARVLAARKRDEFAQKAKKSE